MEGKKLLLAGDYPASRAVYELDLSSFKLAALPPLCTARSRAGLAGTADFFYIFGGCGDNPLKSCERYDLRGRQWLSLGSMHEERYGFTPCIFLGLIYLPSPQTTCTIETFNPETAVFTMLPVSLPHELAWCFAVSFVVSGELYVLNARQQMGQWKIESEGEFRRCTVSKECRSSQPPLVAGNLVLIANNYFGREGVLTFSLESNDFI